MSRLDVLSQGTFLSFEDEEAWQRKMPQAEDSCAKAQRWDKDEGKIECEHMAEGGLGENGIARPHTLVIKLKSTNFQCIVLRQEPTVIYL